jgi:hypothetical protein
MSTTIDPENNYDPTKALLNTIEISPNIECISFKSLYGFVFKIELVKLIIGQTNGKNIYKKSYYNIKNLHNKPNSEEKENSPTHIIIKLVVVENENESNEQPLTDFHNPIDGKKYKKKSNTLNGFNEEVENQNNIYSNTLGQNCIAICPKIFHYKLFDTTTAIQFLDFFDKNVSDDTSTNLMSYLKDNVKDKQLGLIAMEYVQTAKKTNETDVGGYKRDDRVTLYNFLIKQPYEIKENTDTYKIIDKLLLLLPTLKNNPDFLTKINTHANYEIITDTKIKDLFDKEYKSKKDELEDLARIFFRYRIVAHIIYYMVKAYLAGYIHTDLHAGNIYVLNVTTLFNTCIHPFSLNDVGNYQLNNTTILSSYFDPTFDASKLNCSSIQNFCNMSCIEIIDWGRTRHLTDSDEKVEFTNNTTFDQLVEIILYLKTQYAGFNYLFNLVELNGNINTNNLNYKQFYVLWLIYNELKLKAQIDKIDCSNNSKKSEEINTENFDNYLNKFNQRCNSNPFYKIFTLHDILEKKYQ